MKINAINNLNHGSNSNIRFKSSKELSRPDFDDIEASALDSLAIYNEALVSKKPVFDYQNLEDVSFKDEFDDDELIPIEEGIIASHITNMTSMSTKEIVRHIQRTGNLPEWKINDAIERCKYEYGMTDPKQIQHFVEIDRENYIDGLKDSLKKANSEIDKISPTKRPHMVYRVITDDYTPDYDNYINMLKSAEEGDVIELDACPIHISTSARKVMKNYGSRLNKTFLFEIRLPEGSKMLPFPNDGIEQAIMKAGAKFKVIERKQYADDFNYMILEYIPQ